MDSSEIFNFPYILPSQAQKHVTHNETIRIVDALLHLSVRNMTTTSPPVSPSPGERYIIPANASGDWENQEGDIAAYQDEGWMYYAPQHGWRAWLQEEEKLSTFNGTTWIDVSSSSEEANKIGINTTADDANKLSVRSNAVLFDAIDSSEGGDGDSRLKINKEASGNTASLLLQSGFSGRSEIGLTGDDDFHFKVSPDGSTFYDSIVLDKDTGNATFTVNNGGQIKYTTYSVGASPRLSVQSDTTDAARAYFSLRHDTTEFGAFYTEYNSATGKADFVIRAPQNNCDISFVTKNSSGAAWNHLKLDAENRRIGVNEGAPQALLHVDWGGILCGNPTGGDKGTGSVNAQAVYDDNALLSCYVFDQFLDNRIDSKKWDRKVPNRHSPAEMVEVIDEKTGKRRSIVLKETTEEQRTHRPLRKFKGRIGTTHDPLTLEGYAKHWKEKRHLSSMPNEQKFLHEEGMATGEWIQRLVETAEIHAVLIEELHQMLLRQKE